MGFEKQGQSSVSVSFSLSFIFSVLSFREALKTSWTQPQSLGERVYKRVRRRQREREGEMRRCRSVDVQRRRSVSKKESRKLTFPARPDRLRERSRLLTSREKKSISSSSALRMRGRRRKELRRRAAQEWEQRGHVRCVQEKK